MIEIILVVILLLFVGLVVRIENLEDKVRDLEKTR